MATVNPLNADDATIVMPSASAERRRVVQTAEYQDASIPIGLLVVDGRLDIYPELLKTGVLRTYSRDGSLFFQAGGWIGFIPINDKVALEVRPRVPIANLERILCIAGNTSPIVLKGHLHGYLSSDAGLPLSLLDVLAERLATLTESCWNEGLHSEYVARTRIGQSPRGRLLPFQTAKHRTRTQDHLSIVSEQFERTHDTPPNQCLAAALDQLYSIYSGIRNKAGVRVLASRLGRARHLLANVTRTPLRKILAEPLVADPTRLPATRPSYPAAVALAKIVLAGGGIDLRSSGGSASLPPMMISMEQAFEAYLRNVLSDRTEGLLVQDGNMRPPAGASTTLFHDAPASSPSRRTLSTPDIVLSPATAPERKLVIDAKYKPDISRDDLNQVLGYGLTYRSEAVVLACPRKSATAPAGLQLLGEVGGIRVFQYWMDLGATEIEKEEQAFADAMKGLSRVDE